MLYKEPLPFWCQTVTSTLQIAVVCEKEALVFKVLKSVFNLESVAVRCWGQLLRRMSSATCCHIHVQQFNLERSQVSWRDVIRLGLCRTGLGGWGIISFREALHSGPCRPRKNRYDSRPREKKPARHGDLVE